MDIKELKKENKDIDENRDNLKLPAIINECEYRKFTRRFDLPEFETAFKYARCKLDSEDKIREWVNCIYECSLISRERFETIRCYTLFAAHFYSFCTDLKRYEHLVKMILLFAVFDDQTETDWGDVARNHQLSKKIWGNVMNGLAAIADRDIFVDKGDWKPYQLILIAVSESIANKYTDFQKRRFIDAWKYYAQGNIEETIVWETNYRFTSIDDVFRIRLKSIAIRAVIQMVEYSEDIVVPEDQWNSQKFQLLLDLVSKCIICCNDIYSFEKEFGEQHDDLKTTINVVAVVAELEKCTIKVAMDVIVKETQKFEKITLYLINELLSDEKISNTTKQFINRIEHIVGGNWRTSVLLDRYNRWSNGYLLPI